MSQEFDSDESAAAPDKLGGIQLKATAR
jgi:hypothetical protein